MIIAFVLGAFFGAGVVSVLVISARGKSRPIRPEHSFYRPSKFDEGFASAINVKL